ncbi:MAG: MATE family efflux transporter, partial [Polyangiaceae bacterium]
GFLSGLPDKATMQTMWRLSVPSGIRQVFFATGLTVLFWIVGKVGTTELAAANVMINLMLVAYLPGLGLGMAAASLVGQALGKGDRDDAAQWGWDVSKLGLGILGALGLPMLLVPDLLLSAFIDDTATIAVGTLPLRIVGATIAIDGVGQVLQAAMLGAGDSRRVMVVAVSLQWLVFLPVAYAVGPWAGFGLVGIWIAQAVYRFLQAGLFSLMWRDGKWATVEV